MGTASESGDSQITRNFKNGEYDGKEISGIKISLEGYVNNLWGDTTEGLVISGKNLIVQGNDKNVTIVNVSQNDKIENNGGLYATNGSKINFNNLQNVYIAAIGGKEERNDSTAISAKLFGNKVSVSGDTVRLIGSLDVTGWGNQIEVSMSGKDSFWYGSKCGGSLSEVAISLANQATWIFNANESSYNQK